MRIVKTSRGLNQVPGKLKYQIEVGPHRLFADVSPQEGGEDTGPTPHEYLAAALGSCTAITLQMYAVRKSWNLDDIEVEVVVDHEGDVSRFKRSIRLASGLDAAQRKRLLEIANLCPIHKALVGKIEVQTILHD